MLRVHAVKLSNDCFFDRLIGTVATLLASICIKRSRRELCKCMRDKIAKWLVWNWLFSVALSKHDDYVCASELMLAAMTMLYDRPVFWQRFYVVRGGMTWISILEFVLGRAGRGNENDNFWGTCYIWRGIGIRLWYAIVTQGFLSFFPLLFLWLPMGDWRPLLSG